MSIRSLPSPRFHCRYFHAKRLSHFREILGKPELPIARIDDDIDTNDIAACGQDILPMTIIGRFLTHHGLMESKRSTGALIAIFPDILCRPRPVDALLPFAVAEECLSGQ